MAKCTRLPGHRAPPPAAPDRAWPSGVRTHPTSTSLPWRAFPRCLSFLPSAQAILSLGWRGARNATWLSKLVTLIRERERPRLQTRLQMYVHVRTYIKTAWHGTAEEVGPSTTSKG